MQQKKYRPLRTVILLTAVPFLFSLLTSCRPEEETVSETDIRSIEKWLDETSFSPEDFLSEELSTGHPLVLVQDNILRADTVDLMETLVPVSYDLGVRTLGLFFLDTEKQEEIDSFILDGSDKTPAEKLLFSADAALGYSEYCDFISYVQDFNRRLNGDETAIRVVALGSNGNVSPDIFFDTAGLTKPSREDGDDTEAVDSETVPPAFLWITADDLQYLPTLKTNSDPLTNQPVIIIHHGPGDGVLPWNGLMETVTAERDIRDGTFAFRTESPPFEGYSREPPEISADIYIVTAFPYRSVSAIPDFITAETALPALKFFPEIKMEKPLSWAAFRMNRITGKAARRYSRMIEELDLR